MFTEYTPIQYLAIDIANQFGLDKLCYEDRIQWVKTNINKLEDLAPEAEEYHLYIKAVNALRMTQRGLPVGHPVALDAVCSGLQLMSVVMGCKKGASLTGLIYEDVRTDAYTLITEAMNRKLDDAVEVSRADAKSAIMKGLYGSVAAPREVFGDLLPVFYETLNEECPGAMDLLEMLRNAWSDQVDRNTWQLPDGHIAMVPITETVESRIHVAELKYTPVVIHKVVTPKEKGISLIANVVHSLDSYVLRTMIRRCNYNVREVRNMINVLNNIRGYRPQNSDFLAVWEDTGMVDMTMIHATGYDVLGFPQAMREKLLRMLEMCLQEDPFEVVVIHDSYATHPKYCNQLRRVYADVLADLCDSTIIDDLLNQVYQSKDTVDKYGNTKELAEIIRQSNYGIS